MKHLYIALMCCAAVLLLFTAAKAPDPLQFDHKTFDFGTVSESADPIVHSFTFVNVASEPVAVLSVSTGCGCTRPTYPTEPIAPGDSAAILITFTPKGQSGSISKDIKVRYRAATASSSRRTSLRLRGTVIPNP